MIPAIVTAVVTVAIMITTVTMASIVVIFVVMAALDKERHTTCQKNPSAENTGNQ